MPEHPHRRRARGDRGSLLPGAELRGGRDAAEPAARYRQDAHSLGSGEATPGLGRAREEAAMSAHSEQRRCERAELVPLYVLHALPSGEARLLEAHLMDCPDCQRELQSLRPVVDSFASWPTDVLRAPESMW